MSDILIDSVTKALLISTSYPSNAQAWQGRFIADMVEAIGARDDMDLSVWAPPGDLPSNVRSALTAEEAQWLVSLTQSGGIAHLIKNHKLQGLIAALQLLRHLNRVYLRHQYCDVFHINWLQNALPLINHQLRHKPALVTVLGSDLQLLTIPGMVKGLRKAFKGRRVFIAPNANWMEAKLDALFGDLAQVKCIPFGVQKAWFDVNRSHALQAQSREWLMVLRVTRKKMGHLFEWGEGLFSPQRPLHLLGPMQEDVALPNWIQYHGATHPEALLKEWFPRVCGLITLSQHDEGRPQIMLEAMASGLPIIASDLPAHRDLIQASSAGVIVKSPDELSRAIELLEDPVNNQHYGERGRVWMKQNIGDWSDCAYRYNHAYQQLLG